VSRGAPSWSASLVIALVVPLVLVASSVQAPAQARERTTYEMTLKATDSQLSVGQQIDFYGKVRPVTKAVRNRKMEVKLQMILPSGEFGTIDSHKIKRNGRYRFIEFIVEAGTYVMRTRIRAGKGHGEIISDEVTVTVS
jgi:hypothetical protein